MHARGFYEESISTISNTGSTTKLSYVLRNLNHCKAGRVFFYKGFFLIPHSPFLCKWTRRSSGGGPTRGPQGPGARLGVGAGVGLRARAQRRLWKDHMTPAPTTAPKSEVSRREPITAGLRTSCLGGQILEAASGL